MQVKKDEKKEAIIKAAAKLLAEKGEEALSISNIAKVAKVGKGTIYTYFSSKDEIVIQIAKSTYDSFIEDIRDAYEKSGSSEEFIESIGNNIFRDIEERGRIIYIVHRLKIDYKKAYEEFVENYQKILKLVSDRFFPNINFNELYFIVTSFMMTSYMMIKDIGREELKKIFKNSLKKLLMV